MPFGSVPVHKSHMCVKSRSSSPDAFASSVVKDSSAFTLSMAVCGSALIMEGFLVVKDHVIQHTEIYKGASPNPRNVSSSVAAAVPGSASASVADARGVFRHQLSWGDPLSTLNTQRQLNAPNTNSGQSGSFAFHHLKFGTAFSEPLVSLLQLLVKPSVRRRSKALSPFFRKRP